MWWRLFGKLVEKSSQINPQSLPTQLNIQDAIDFALSLFGG